MKADHLRLSAGTPAGCRLVAIVGGLLLASITAFFVAVLIYQTNRFVTRGDFGVSAVATFAGLLLIVGVLLYAVGAMTWVYLRIGRTRIWLRDGVLVQRGIVMRRRIDLRTARVEMRTDNDALVLVATDQLSGKSLEVPIQKDRATLPASELAALAEAIIDDQQIAARLRALAAAKK